MTLIRMKFARSLDWNLLKIFHEIVVSEGVTAAAVSLSRKQSTISYALKKLETELGVRLCIRGRAGFRLTDEGQILHEKCLSIFGKVNDIPNDLDNLSREIHGKIKIQMISNIICPQLDRALTDYINGYPYVELDIDVVPWEGISRAILRNNIDIGIAPAGIQYAELDCHLLFREKHRAYCHAGHPLFGKTIQKLKLLSREKFVLTGNDEPDQLTKFRLKYNLGHYVGGISSSLEEAKRLAVAGAGICFLPEGFTENEVKSGQLWPVTASMDELTLEIFLISRQRTPQPLAQQLFINKILEHRPKII